MKYIAINDKDSFGADWVFVTWETYDNHATLVPVTQKDCDYSRLFPDAELWTWPEYLNQADNRLGRAWCVFLDDLNR